MFLRSVVLLGLTNLALAEPAPSGVPADAPDELLGLADGAAVWAERMTYTLPAPGGTASVSACTIHVYGGTGEPLDYTFEPGVVVDGVAHPRWRETRSDDAALEPWRARLRSATAHGTSCDDAIAFLRSSLHFSAPKKSKTTINADALESLQQELHVDGAVLYSGPTPERAILVGLRNKQPWRCQIYEVKP